MAQANHTRTEKNNQQFPPIISRKTLDSSRYGGGINCAGMTPIGSSLENLRIPWFFRRIAPGISSD
jgi:hypothetical protein